MTRSIRSGLMLGVAASTYFIAAPALAQGTTGTEAENSANGDIIVTARRVEERLQDVPISITVYTQEALTNRNIAIATDLATYTPSLSVNQRFGPEKASFGIRGFNQDISTAPSVGVYFADVVGVRAQAGTVSGNTIGAGSFMDLQNVQVLKGPQGTLFGRNTTGGAVLLVPNKPKDRLEGFVEGSAGNYDMWRAHAVVNVPLSDTLRVRAAVERQNRGGFMKNHSGIGPDNYNDVNYFAARFSVVADLTPDLENYTIFHYSNSFANGYAARILLCDPAGVGVRGVTALAACNQIARQAARGDGLLDVEVNNPNPRIGIKQWQVINTTTWKASESLTIKNIMSFGEFRERSIFSLNSDNFFITPTPGIPSTTANAGKRFRHIFLDLSPTGDTSSGRSFTEELQFQGTTGDGRFIWQAGGYLEFSRPIGWSESYVATFANCTNTQTLQCSNDLGFGLINSASTKYKFDNHGIYAQGTYKVTPALSLTAGFRYTFDKITGIGEGTRINAVGLPTQLTRCTDALRFRQPGSPAPIGLIVTDKSQCHFEIQNNSSKPTWLLGLDFKPSEDILVYAKYARGYRQGGINMGNIGLESWLPEKVDSYEVGVKASFRGAVSGFFNIAGFYNNLSDQQIFSATISRDLTVITGGSAIVNAGKSRIQGIEVDASVNLFRNFRLDLGYTYLDTKVIDIVAPTLPAGSPFNAVVPTVNKGEALTLSPKNRVTLTASYTLPLDESVGKITLGATFTHTDKNQSNATSPLGILPATDLLNLNVSWNRFLGSPVDLAFFATNVTNEIYPVNVGGGLVSSGYENILMGQPRMWGFRLRYSFGD